MPRYAAFLRGINVAGRRATKEQLCSCLEALDFAEVTTFRASGNVIFEAGPEPLDAMAARIEEGLAESLGYRVTIFLRSRDEVRAIAGHQPFPAALVRRSEGKLQVMLLADEPPAPVRREVLAMATEQDGLTLLGRELYWLPSGPMRDSGLKLRKVETLLGSNTMRTKGTIEQIAEKYFAA